MCNARTQNYVKKNKEIEKAPERNSAIEIKCHR